MPFGIEVLKLSTQASAMAFASTSALGALGRFASRSGKDPGSIWFAESTPGACWVSTDPIVSDVWVKCGRTRACLEVGCQ